MGHWLGRMRGERILCNHHNPTPVTSREGVPTMSLLSRRTLLKTTAASIAAATLHSNLRAAGANARLIIGIIGPGGQGSNHLRVLAGRKDVEIAWVCDVDSQRMDRAAQEAAT